jgi:hypothetical protein
MLLYLPFAMLFWHAPALVHWHDVAPVKSLFFSIMACWKNKTALLVYMVCWLGVFMTAGVAMSLMSALIGSTSLANVLVFPLVLVMASMFFTSTYYTFRDSFVDDAAVPPAPQG